MTSEAIFVTNLYTHECKFSDIKNGVENVTNFEVCVAFYILKQYITIAKTILYFRYAQKVWNK